MNLLEIVPGINFPVTSAMAIPAILAMHLHHLQLVGSKHGHGLPQGHPVPARGAEPSTSS